MSTIKAIPSLASVLRRPKISRRRLSRYSWLPDVLRLQGSIVPRIFGPVLTCTTFATAIAYAWHTGHNVTLSNSVTPLLAVVVGLILVFRNGTSYDRWIEGRKDFAALQANLRSLARMIWINVAVPAPDQFGISSVKGKAPGGYLTVGQLRRKKAYVAKLCLSFAYATKHYLRSEPGMDWQDYAGVLPPAFARYDETGFDTSYSPGGSYTENQNGTNGACTPVGGKTPTKMPTPHGMEDSAATLADHRTPLLSHTSHRAVEFHPFASQVSPLPLPLIIAHEIHRSIFAFKRDGYLETVGPAGTNAMTQIVAAMVDQLTAMERVANTPIPQSYGIHLKQCVTLYLFSLPFTLVRDLGWGMIPVVTAVAFTLMGIEGIADEIEYPFGKDATDLPLDQYCLQLKDEIEYMLTRLPDGGEGVLGYDDGEGDD